MNTHSPPRRMPIHPLRGWLRATALVSIALAAAVLYTVMPAQREAAAECPGGFTLDFNGLPAGTILSEQYAGSGVHISAVANGDHPDALIVFDTNAPPTHDPDLAVDIGNIAILAENVRDQNGDGLVDDPDENNFGGTVTFTFDQDVTIGSFVFVDHDHQPADFAAAYDASGNLITKVLIPIGDNGSVQNVAVNAEGVRRFELVYRDSAGFTDIEIECEQPGGGATPTPAGGGGETPTPTPAGGGQATPTATPSAAAGAGTPTPNAGAQGTPTPAVAGQSSSPTGQQPVAVAAAVQPPAAQPQAAPQPAAVPAGGGRPSDGGTMMSWLAVVLMGLGLALSGGGALAAVREIRRRV